LIYLSNFNFSCIIFRKGPLSSPILFQGPTRHEHSLIVSKHNKNAPPSPDRRKLKSLAKHPPEKSKQIDYFDDATKGGVRGLLLKHSYGGTLAFFVMYYEGGKSKLFKLGKYPVLKLAPARQAALEFLANPKKHT